MVSLAPRHRRIVTASPTTLQVSFAAMGSARSLECSVPEVFKLQSLACPATAHALTIADGCLPACPPYPCMHVLRQTFDLHASTALQQDHMNVGAYYNSVSRPVILP